MLRQKDKRASFVIFGTFENFAGKFFSTVVLATALGPRRRRRRNVKVFSIQGPPLLANHFALKEICHCREVKYGKSIT